VLAEQERLQQLPEHLRLLVGAVVVAVSPRVLVRVALVVAAQAATTLLEQRELRTRVAVREAREVRQMVWQVVPAE
jgi:hypothetical protein